MQNQSAKVDQDYNNTIGKLPSGGRPVFHSSWNIQTQTEGGKTALYSLGEFPGHGVDKDILRDAVRAFFKPALGKRESIRVLFGLVGYPRIDLRLQKKSDFDATPVNSEVFAKMQWLSERQRDMRMGGAGSAV